MRYKNYKYCVLTILLLQGIVINAGWAETKSGFTSDPGFGGPNSVNAQLAEDDIFKLPSFRYPEIDESLQSWFDWKKALNKKHSLKLGTDYSVLYQRANDVVSGDKYAASGALRFFGNWTLVGRGTKNSGSLVFKVEHRHKLGSDVAPAGFAGNIGYLGVTGTLYSDVKGVLVDLNWQQRFNNGEGGLVVGRFDPNDFIDVLGYANPWTTFSNVAILLNTSMAFPDASWGIGVGSWVNNQWYVLGTVNDANGTITDTSFFEGGSELFKSVEFGWSPSRKDRFFNNINVTYWHVDERELLSIPKSDGIGISANKMLGEKWMLFGRVGWSDGLAPLMQKTATLGFIHRSNKHSDLLGLGLNWGDPSDESLRVQTTTELFYRWQVAQNLAVTPSVQWLIDPAFNTNEDDIWIVGLRARFTL